MSDIPDLHRDVNAPVTARFATSRAGYTLFGACVGGLYGLLPLMAQGIELKDVALMTFAGIIAGALVGRELHGSRRWDRFGQKGTLARWTVACASAAAAIGAGLSLLGHVSHAQFWMLVGFGAVVGVGFGIESFEADQQSRVPKR